MARSQFPNAFADLAPYFSASMPITEAPLKDFFEAENYLIAGAGGGPAGGVLATRGVLKNIEFTGWTPIVTQILCAPKRGAFLRLILEGSPRAGYAPWEFRFSEAGGAPTTLQSVSSAGRHVAIGAIGASISGSVTVTVYVKGMVGALTAITWDWMELGYDGSWPYSFPPLGDGDLIAPPLAVAADTLDAQNTSAISADVLLEIRERAEALSTFRRPLATAAWWQGEGALSGLVYGRMPPTGVPFAVPSSEALPALSGLRIDVFCEWSDTWRIWLAEATPGGRRTPLWEDTTTGSGARGDYTFTPPAEVLRAMIPGRTYAVYATGASPIDFDRDFTVWGEGDDFFADAVEIYAVTVSVTASLPALPPVEALASGKHARGLVLQAFCYYYAVLSAFLLPRRCTWWDGGDAPLGSYDHPKEAIEGFQAALPLRAHGPARSTKWSTIYAPAALEKADEGTLSYTLGGVATTIYPLQSTDVGWIMTPSLSVPYGPLFRGQVLRWAHDMGTQLPYADYNLDLFTRPLFYVDSVLLVSLTVEEIL